MTPEKWYKIWQAVRFGTLLVVVIRAVYLVAQGNPLIDAFSGNLPNLFLLIAHAIAILVSQYYGSRIDNDKK